MYLRALCFNVATVAVMLTSVCYAEFCDGGPTGKYCFDDLTGYHDCVLDNSTGKFVDNMVHCPTNTRCTCMGLPCTTDTPCGPYKRPPAVFVGDFTTDFDRILNRCNPTSCITTFTFLAVWRDIKHKKYRYDVYTMETREPSHKYWIYLPNDQSSFDEYNIIPEEKSCSKTTVPTFPSNKFPNMTLFSYNGTETISGIVCERWIWMAGGRRKGEVIRTLIFYFAGEKPFQYRGTFPSSSQEYGEIQIFFGKYIAGTPDPDAYELPSYCETTVKRHPKQDFNADYWKMMNTVFKVKF